MRSMIKYQFVLLTSTITSNVRRIILLAKHLEYSIETSRLPSEIKYRILPTRKTNKQTTR